MAGFRPGFGLGGITHSLLRSDDAVPGLLAGGEAAAIGEGLMLRDGCRKAESSVLTTTGEAACSGGGLVFNVEDMFNWRR